MFSNLTAPIARIGLLPAVQPTDWRHSALLTAVMLRAVRAALRGCLLRPTRTRYAFHARNAHLKALEIRRWRPISSPRDATPSALSGGRRGPNDIPARCTILVGISTYFIPGSCGGAPLCSKDEQNQPRRFHLVDYELSTFDRCRSGSRRARPSWCLCPESEPLFRRTADKEKAPAEAGASTLISERGDYFQPPP